MVLEYSKITFLTWKEEARGLKMETAYSHRSGRRFSHSQLLDPYFFKSLIFGESMETYPLFVLRFALGNTAINTRFFIHLYCFAVSRWFRVGFALTLWTWYVLHYCILHSLVTDLAAWARHRLWITRIHFSRKCIHFDAILEKWRTKAVLR